MESAGDEGSGGEESGNELEALQAELSEMMGAEDAEPEQQLEQPGGAEAKVEAQIREASATVAAVLSATAATVQALTAVEIAETLLRDHLTPRLGSTPEA